MAEAYVERVIGTFRRQCLDNVIVLSERSLCRGDSDCQAAMGLRSAKMLQHPDIAVVSDFAECQAPAVGGGHRPVNPADGLVKLGCFPV